MPRSSKRPIKVKGFKIRPLTLDNWSDFEDLFGEKGACAGCWCMYWRLTRTKLEQGKGSGNKRALKRLVRSGTIPGIIAYDKNEPIGWCSVGPREEFGVLDRSRILKRVDDKPVWSLVCLFIHKSHRRIGISGMLIEAALKFAKQNGAKIVEGYPYDLGDKKWADPFVWTGLASSFVDAGFVEVARRSAQRPIMRYFLSRA